MPTGKYNLLYNVQAEDRSNTAENQIGRLRATSQVAQVLMKNLNILIIKNSFSPATTASTTDTENQRRGRRRRKKNRLFVNTTNPCLQSSLSESPTNRNKNYGKMM